MPRRKLPECGYTLMTVIRGCVDCGASMKCPAKTTKPRTLCDDCRAARKAKGAADKLWNVTRHIKCSRCNMWFNRSALSSETVCAPCRRGEGPTHGLVNTYNRGCRCSDCASAYAAYRKPSPEKPRQLTCETCGNEFTGNRRRKYCSEDCWVKTAPGYRKDIKGSHRKRAKRFGVDYEPLDRRAVFVRDGWVCGICGDAVDPILRYPHRRSATIDHIVPISRGGPHVENNVQCAHWDCNILKRDREAA